MSTGRLESDPTTVQGSSQRVKNARARIFFLAFFLAAALSLTWTFVRPAVYVSTASLAFTPAKQQALPPAAQGPGHTPVSLSGTDGSDAAGSPFLETEVQRLTSQAIIADVVRRLQGQAAGDISVSHLMDMLHAETVPGTHILELSAQGRRPDRLPPIVNAWIESYLDAWKRSHQHDSSDDLHQLQEKVDKLHHQVEQKRAALDQFRAKYGILSMGGDSNSTLASDSNDAIAKVRSLTKALNDARNTQVQAESNLQAMKDALARGQSVVLPEDKAHLADLEKRAMDLRDQLTTLQDKFTPLYISKDPKYRDIKPTLQRLEKQIRRERQASEDQAVSRAEQAVTSARDTVSRLKAKLHDYKRNAMEFTKRFDQHKQLVGELNNLDGLYNAAQDRLTEMQTSSEQTRIPQVSVLNQPSLPDAPAYPNYSRDAAVSAGGSVLFALLAVFFVEFLNRSGGHRPAPAAAMQPRIQIANFPEFPGRRQRDDTEPGQQARLLPASVDNLPRELSTPEILALTDAAREESRVVIVALLSGLTVEELATITWSDVDLDTGVIHLPDARIHPLREPLTGILAAQRAAHPGASSPLSDDGGSPMAASDLEGLIACTAHDAGIGAPADVNSAVLRHTYIAFLVRQGVRLSELPRIVGRIPPALFSAYGRLSPPGPGLAVDQIQLVPPALAGYA